jgi:TDG/mug DNA glycosylase family protein
MQPSQPVQPAQPEEVLSDVLQPDLRLVICGTAVGNRSAAEGSYYAHPTNRFWATLYVVGLTPRRLASSEYMELLECGIGLTDISKHAVGRDSRLRRSDADPRALHRKIRENQPRLLVFNGKEAARLYFGSRGSVDYGLRDDRIGSTQLFVAPSTSGSASAYWDERWWRKIAELLKQPPSASNGSDAAPRSM